MWCGDDGGLEALDEDGVQGQCSWEAQGGACRDLVGTGRHLPHFTDHSPGAAEGKPLTSHWGPPQLHSAAKPYSRSAPCFYSSCSLGPEDCFVDCALAHPSGLSHPPKPSLDTPAWSPRAWALVSVYSCPRGLGSGPPSHSAGGLLPPPAATRPLSQVTVDAVPREAASSPPPPCWAGIAGPRPVRSPGRPHLPSWVTGPGG